MSQQASPQMQAVSGLACLLMAILFAMLGNIAWAYIMATGGAVALGIASYRWRP